MKKTTPVENLISVMARLRHPTEGCPWDREQTFASVAPYTIEEAYEVSDAIERNDMSSLKEELGDLLLQIVFHSRMAEESGDFDFNEVALDPGLILARALIREFSPEKLLPWSWEI